MSEKNAIIVHGRYNYRPEVQGDKYVVVYFETGSTQIVMETKDLANLGNPATLQELAENLNKKLNTVGHEIVMKSFQEFEDEDPTLLEGQIGAETDNHFLKIGDGENPYSELPFYSKPTAFDTFKTLKKSNPRMAPGQFSFERDTGKIKVGNGKKTFLELPYYYVPEKYVNPDYDRYTFDGLVDDFIAKLNLLFVRPDWKYSHYAINDVYNENQIGYEYDDRRVKIGDGIKDYETLDYIVEATRQVLENTIEFIESTIEFAKPGFKTEASYADDFVCEDGKLYVETDTSLVKIGDGETPWHLLPYSCVTPEHVRKRITELMDTIKALQPIHFTDATANDLQIVVNGRILINDDTGEIYISNGRQTAIEHGPVNLGEITEEDLSMIVDARDSNVQIVYYASGAKFEVEPEFIEGLNEEPVENKPDVFYEITV